GGLLITILVVNEVVNISLTTILTEVVARLRSTSEYAAQPFLFIPSWAADTLCGILVTAPIVLFLGEVTPKVIAARANQLVASVALSCAACVSHGPEWGWPPSVGRGRRGLGLG